MKKIDSMFPTDDSLSGHGLTLTKVYRSYKGSPHNVNATYLKYLVHRLENADKYKQATPDKQFKMDIDFLDHHQRGGAAVKNGRMRASDLEEFMKNPDTPKLAKQLLNHKKQLIDLIQKEHADHIVNINGEPHIRLTRGLNVTKKQRGVDHALASYADVPDPDFGEYMHHQLVPLKNVWFAYDYGPKAALEPTSLDRAYGSEDEFLVSPHKNIYSKDSKINPTKPIAYRKFHGLKINKKTISDYIDNYPEEAIKNKKFAHMLEPRHIDTIVQRNSYFAAQHLKDRLTPEHIDTIVDLHPTAAAHHLADRLNDKHIDTLVQNAPDTVAYSLSTLGHRLTNKHIDSIVQNDPDSAAYKLKDKLTSNHIQTIAEKEPKTAACYLYDHFLLNTNHIDTIVKNAPIEAAEYLHNHKLLNANHIQTIAENNPEAAAYYLKDHPLLNTNHIQTIAEKAPKAAKHYLSNHPIYQAKYGNKVQKSLQKSIKQASEVDSIFHHSDHSQKGHGLTLTKMYHSYKNSPHNVDATYGKYLVHRLENADKYESANPQEKFKMDIDFLDHHQRGSAAEKNGHLSADSLESFMLNPDTPKLAKQLLNHKKQLSNFIQKEHSEHIVNINGEPHLRLTRGLHVDKANRGADHALASYADVPDTGFGTYMHHQFVPLKNIWFAYDYGPKEATSEKHGNENEFVVSPHKNIYSAQETEPMLYRNFHNLKMNKDTVSDYIKNNPEVAAQHLRNHKLLNTKHIQTIVENDPEAAAQYLKNHRLFNQNHFDTIVELSPSIAAQYLKNHRLFNQNHFDTIMQNDPWIVAQHLHNHPLLSEQHIDIIVKNHPSAARQYLSNHPIYQAKYGNKVQKSLQKSTKISKQLSDKVRQLLNSKVVLNKTRGTLKFPKILPKDTRPEENVKQIPKDEPEHEMYGGLYTVKPTKQQFMESALTEVPQNYRYKAAQKVQDEMQGGLRGVYTPKTKRAFAFEPDFAFKGHEAIHAMVDKAAAHFGVDKKQVYEHLNSLIHPEDKQILAHTLKANDYPAHTHHSEMVPWIHTILHYKPAREHFFESLKFYKNNVDEAKQRQAVQRLGRTWNAIVKMGKELERLP